VKDLTPKMDESTRAKAAERLAEMVSQGYTAPKCLQVIRDDYDHYATKHSLGNLRRHLAYKEYMNALAEENITSAKNELKVGVSAMVPYILANLKKQIGKGSAQAIGLSLKVLGVENETEQKQDTSITVVMSGSSNEKDVTSRDNTIEAIRGTKT
jgi:hypothetical protein